MNQFLSEDILAEDTLAEDTLVEDIPAETILAGESTALTYERVDGREFGQLVAMVSAPGGTFERFAENTSALDTAGQDTTTVQGPSTEDSSAELDDENNEPASTTTKPLAQTTTSAALPATQETPTSAQQQLSYPLQHGDLVADARREDEHAVSTVEPQSAATIRRDRDCSDNAPGPSKIPPFPCASGTRDAKELTVDPLASPKPRLVQDAKQVRKDARFSIDRTKSVVWTFGRYFFLPDQSGTRRRFHEEISPHDHLARPWDAAEEKLSLDDNGPVTPYIVYPDYGFSIDKAPPGFWTDLRGNLPLLKTIMWQMFSALEHIHKFGWVHADVKPGNVVISMQKNAQGQLICHLRLIDFEESRPIAELTAPESKLETQPRRSTPGFNLRELDGDPIANDWYGFLMTMRFLVFPEFMTQFQNGQYVGGDYPYSPSWTSRVPLPRDLLWLLTQVRLKPKRNGRHTPDGAE